jgi:segregation and condensation protein A
MSDDKIGQNQFFDLITGEELGWQSIIYDLIKTEQLDPWDIDISVLAEKYLEMINNLEDADFFISSKVLLACSLLLRLKSEILVNSYIKSLDDALYGRKKEEEKPAIERLNIEEGELPNLIPRTPMARHRKVTLKELMSALNNAIDTENRRIKREIRGHQTKKAILKVMPRENFIPLKISVKKIFGILKNHIEEGNDHMKFSHIASEREERLASFIPILHLSNNEKIYLKQKTHFGDIQISLEKCNEEFLELKEELGLIGETTKDSLED